MTTTETTAEATAAPAMEGGVMTTAAMEAATALAQAAGHRDLHWLPVAHALFPLRRFARRRPLFATGAFGCVMRS